MMAATLCAAFGAGRGGARAAGGPADSTAVAPHLEVLPARVLAGDPVSVRAIGLRPGSLATIHAQSMVPDDAGNAQPYLAEATYAADARGTIDPATAAPVRGSYRGVDARGLFWSQRPAVQDSMGERALAALHVQDITSIRTGEVALTLEQDGVVEDRRLVTFVPGDSDVVREAVSAAGLVGVFYHRKGALRAPVVVALGGSEGGLDVADWLGPKLASRGFVVFGLDYYSPPGSAAEGVPTALNEIPVELLEQARAWLAARPEADVNRLGIVGYSKGAEFALVLASTYPWVHAVVAFAASDYVWQGVAYGGGVKAGSSWTRSGHDLPYLPTTGTREEIARGRAAGGGIELARVARANLAAATASALAAAAIPMERSHAALMLIGGGDDQLWDSGASVERAAARLRRAGYRHAHLTLVYLHAGHRLLGTGWQPTTSGRDDFFREGGTPEADARAQADAWVKALAFLRRELRH